MFGDDDILELFVNECEMQEIVWPSEQGDDVVLKLIRKGSQGCHECA